MEGWSVGVGERVVLYFRENRVRIDFFAHRVPVLGIYTVEDHFLYQVPRMLPLHGREQDVFRLERWSVSTNERVTARAKPNSRDAG